MLTQIDVNDYILKWEETYFLEYFGITTEQLVDRFQDLVEDRFDELEEEAAAELL